MGKKHKDKSGKHPSKKKPPEKKPPKDVPGDRREEDADAESHDEG